MQESSATKEDGRKSPNPPEQVPSNNFTTSTNSDPVEICPPYIMPQQPETRANLDSQHQVFILDSSSWWRQFGRVPVDVKCPYCGHTGFTKISSTPGNFTWISSIFGLIFGWWMCCCVFPFLLNSFKDLEHSCSNCGAVLGTREAP